LATVRTEHARVLITVKASPQPSLRYGDTVCVAGIRIDKDEPSWIRLYPVPFRYMGAEQQFRKYDIIDLDVTRRHEDSRAESYNPILESISATGHLGGWKERVPYLNSMAIDTACGLRRKNEGNPSGQSLGLVRARSVQGMEFEPHPGWSRAEKAKIANYMSQPDLFSTTSQGTPKLVAPRFKAYYRYTCEDDDCKGKHRQQVLDWEMSQLQRHLRGEDDSNAKAKIEARFVDMMCAAKRSPSFFMGNFEKPTKRQIFSILGVAYPETVLSQNVALF
jgi:hypothetical protein